jgi:hypothetical protein
MKRFLALSLLLLGPIVACGGDGSGGTGPTQIDLTGTWAVTMSPISGNGLSCTISGLEVTLAQSETVVTGTYALDDMVCNGEHTGPGGGDVVSGSEVGGKIHIHLDTEDFDLHGSCLSASRCNGTYSLTVFVDPTTYTFTGTWSATRM